MGTADVCCRARYVEGGIGGRRNRAPDSVVMQNYKLFAIPPNFPPKS